jgi:hypothetical protein
MESVQLQRNQTLIVIHAENGIPIALRRVMENRIGGKGTGEDCGFSIFDFRLQLFQRREDQISFFFSHGAGFAGMWIETGDRDTRSTQAALSKKIFQKQTDADDLCGSQRVRNFAERNVRGNESDGKFPARQQHGEIAHAASVGEELGLPGEFETDLVHAGFVNWPGDDGVNFTAKRQLDSFFQRLQGGTRRFRSGLA